MQLLRNSTSAEDLLAFLNSKKGEELKRPNQDVPETATLHLEKSMPSSTNINHNNTNIIPHLEDALNYLDKHLPVDLENCHPPEIYPLHELQAVHHPHQPVFDPSIISRALDLAETFAYAEPNCFPGNPLPTTSHHQQDQHQQGFVPPPTTHTRNQSSSDNTHQDACTAPPTAATTANGRPVRRTAARAREQFNRAHRYADYSNTDMDSDMMSHSDSDDNDIDGDGYNNTNARNTTKTKHQQSHASSRRQHSSIDNDNDNDVSASVDHMDDGDGRRNNNNNSRKVSSSSSPLQHFSKTQSTRNRNNNNTTSTINTNGTTTKGGKSVRALQRKAYDAMIDPGLPPDEVRKLRRMLSNRESARRSRKRKADQISTLEEELQEAHAVIAQLRDELEDAKKVAASMHAKLQHQY